MTDWSTWLKAVGADKQGEAHHASEYEMFLLLNS